MVIFQVSINFVWFISDSGTDRDLHELPGIHLYVHLSLLDSELSVSAATLGIMHLSCKSFSV